MRIILLLLDGLGDRGHRIYGGKTPLQAASTPNLDYISKISANGSYHSSIPGIAMPSEMAHFLLFGYDLQEFPGRGPIEALGYSLPFGKGDVAVLARIFVTRKEKGMLIVEEEDPVVDRETCTILQETVRSFEGEGLEFTFYPTSGIEGIIVIGGNASGKITDSNPIHEGRPLMEILPLADIGEEWVAAEKTAKILNRYLVWCHRKLSAHPANRKRERKGLLPINALGTQRAGKQKNLKSFNEKWGLKGLSISSEAVYRGLCRMIGMETLMVEESGNHERDLFEKLKCAHEARDFDFVHVHTKAPDVAAHTKDPERKRSVIESLDNALSYAVKEIVTDDELLFIVTSDHSTPSSGRMIHSGEPVPLMMRGKHVRVDDVSKFNETSCQMGALGLLRGPELMYTILSLTDRGKLWGLMDSPANAPYFPGKSKPLIIK